MIKNYNCLNRWVAVIAAWVILLVTGSFSTLVFAQNNCGLSIDAGEDVFICTGNSIQLNATISGGNNPQVSWSPSSGLSDPSILNPIASPGQTTTYTLSVMANSENLFINGDFETQDILPSTTQYTLAPTPLDIGTNAPNYYAILSVPQIVQTFGCNPDIGDYTLVVHGSTGVNVNILCQTINVTPNKDYKIKYKVFGIPYFISPAPNIVVKINGQQIGSVTAPNSSCGQADGEFMWNSGSNTSAEICFANSTVATFGSMCAIDDIEFVECCVETDEITVTVDEGSEVFLEYVLCPGSIVEEGGQSFDTPGNYTINLLNQNGCDSIVYLDLQYVEVEAIISITNELNCLNEEAVLLGTSSSGTFGIQSYVWQTGDGVILSDPEDSFVVIGGAGTYTLIVTTSDGNISCMSEAFIVVDIDTAAPFFYIEEPPLVTCQDSTIVLVANGNWLPPGVIIQWIAIEGSIISGENTLTPTVSGVGYYILQITNPQNGCTSFDEVVVNGDNNLPVILLDSISTINCRDTLGLIRVTVSLPEVDRTLSWSTMDGNIVGPENLLTVVFDSAGSYQLIATDITSGCTSTVIYRVEGDTEIPSIILRDRDTLSCDQQEILVEVRVEQDFDTLVFLWSTQDGVIRGRTDSSGVMLAGAGTYKVIVENPVSGCLDSAFIEIISDDDIPIASAGPDLVLNCETTLAFPMSGNSSSGSAIRYLWRSDNVIIEDSTTISPGLNTAGIYILTVINLDNQCIATDTLELSENYSAPELSIPPADTLTCSDSMLSITALTDYTDNLIFEWVGPMSGIESGAATSTIQLKASGWYFVIVKDSTSGCSNIDSIFVEENKIIPIVNINTPDTINCQNQSVELNASGSSGAGPLLFEWTNSGGGILSGENSSNPRVMLRGYYILLLTDSANGCSAVDSVFVDQNQELPDLDIEGNDQLNCIVRELDLRANFSVSGALFGLEWFTSDGNIIGDRFSQAIKVSTPGIYYLLLTDSISNCSVLDSIAITEDLYLPEVWIQTPDTLTCRQTMVEIVSDNDDPLSVLNYHWSTDNGAISGAYTEKNVLVSLTGRYKLVFTSVSNGCEDSLFVDVEANLLKPLSDPGLDLVIPCGGNEVMLDGSGSTGQGSITFSWETQNGLIISGSDGPIATVAAAGTYLLIVTETSNGCRDSAMVEVRHASPGNIDYELIRAVCEGEKTVLIIRESAGLQVPYNITIAGLAGIYAIGDSIDLAPGIVQIIVEDSNMCLVDITIQVDEPDNIVLQYPTSIALAKGETGIIDITTNIPPDQILEIRWFPGTGITEGNSILNWLIRNPAGDVYRFEIVTKSGCIASGMIIIEEKDLEDSGIRVFVPDAFSPGTNDGINDRFYPIPSDIEGVSIKNMRVFNRWGSMVYFHEELDLSNPGTGWDGSFRGKLLNPDVFFWTMEVFFPDGKVQILKGSVQLL